MENFPQSKEAEKKIKKKEDQNKICGYMAEVGSII